MAENVIVYDIMINFKLYVYDRLYSTCLYMRTFLADPNFGESQAQGYANDFSEINFGEQGILLDVKHYMCILGN